MLDLWIQEDMQLKAAKDTINNPKDFLCVVMYGEGSVWLILSDCYQVSFLWKNTDERWMS